MLRNDLRAELIAASRIESLISRGNCWARNKAIDEVIERAIVSQPSAFQDIVLRDRKKKLKEKAALVNFLIV